MKRLLTLVLCLMLALTAVSAQAVSIANIVGRWYFVRIDNLGAGADTYAEFNRNRSVTLVVHGEPVDTEGYEWTFANNAVTVKNAAVPEFDLSLLAKEDELIVYTHQLGVLTDDSRYHEFVLAREPVVYDAPAMVPAASEDQFYGDYVLYLAVSNGLYMPMPSEDNGFEIEEYMATVYSEGQAPAEYLTDFTDGRLTVYADVVTYISTTEDPDVLVTYTDDTFSNAAYLRRRSSQPKADPAPEATEAPEATKTPTSPSFPAMIVTPVSTPAPAAPTEAPAAPIEAPAAPEATETPASPSFPSMIVTPVNIPGA